MKKLFLLFSIGTFLGFSTAKAQSIVALSASGNLVHIADATMPAIVGSPIAISGVTLGQSIVGIDYRPNTGELYALGYNNLLLVANAQLYVLNATTGAATPIGTALTLNLGSAGIGFDFNPTVDRIRVVAQNGANYRLHPVTGAIAATDGMLAFATADPNASVSPNIAACAYTNSYIGTETTTLFDYDKILNLVASQIPPNNGTLNTIGSSGVIVSATSDNIGMDIYFDPISKTNAAYINAIVGGLNNLYKVNTTTGAFTLLGTIGTGVDPIREIAVKIDRNVPATYSGQLIYGLTRVNRNLVKFSSDNPELIRELLPITGITSGQVLVGMDVRPVSLELYAIGYHDTSRTYQLYSINKTNGVATAVGSSGKINLGIGEKIGFDFNPTVDRIRVISSNDSNFRLHPLTGAIAATDTSFSYNSADINMGKNPYVSSVAYTNSYKGTTTTGLLGIDDSIGAFVSVVPPNQGFLNTLASSILPFNLADLTNDLDFFYDSTTTLNIGFMAANTGSSANDVLYSLTTAGAVTMIDTIGLGVQLYDVAVQLSYTGSSTSIAKLKSPTSLNVYPVPVKDNLTIKLQQAFQENKNALITDFSGRIIKSFEVSKNAILINVDVSELPTGLYLIKISGEYGATKFVKQ